MSNKRQFCLEASERHSNKKVQIKSVDSEIEETLSRIDFSAGNLKVKIERHRIVPSKCRKKNRLIKLTLIIFLVYWTLSGNQSMSFDALVVTLFQLIQK